MNVNFFDLPNEKQRNLFNAGCKIFACNSYKKASMSKVAEEANISKSLIFYYFKNKKEYYFFILNRVIQEMNEYLTEIFDDNEPYDLFEKFLEIIELKENYFQSLKLYYEFLRKAYYERDESLLEGLKEVNLKLMEPYDRLLQSIDKSKFKNIYEVNNCVKILIYSAHGLLSDTNLEATINWNAKVNEYKSIMSSLRRHYYKEVH